VAGTRCTRWTPASHRSMPYAPGDSTSRIASCTCAPPPEPELVTPSAVSYLRVEVRNPIREQYASYMRNTSPAKIAASSPPAPGRISIRQGRCAKGCTGIKLVFSASDDCSILSREGSTSSSASSRNSLSGDFNKSCSSLKAERALSYSFKAAAVPDNCPSRFADLAS